MLDARRHALARYALARYALLLSLCTSSWACGGGGGGGGAATPGGPDGGISIVVMDVGPSELKAFEVTVTHIAIVPLGGAPLAIFPPPESPGLTLAADLVDLLKVGKTIAAANVPAGVYTAFDLTLASPSAVRKDGTPLGVTLSRPTIRVVPTRPITVDPSRPQNVWMDFHLASSLRQVGPTALELDPVITATVSAMPVGLADLEGRVARVVPSRPGFDLSIDGAALIPAGTVPVSVATGTVLFDGATVRPDLSDPAALARIEAGARVRISALVTDIEYLAAAVTLLLAPDGSPAAAPVVIDGVVTRADSGSIDVALLAVVRDEPGTLPAMPSTVRVELAAAAVARAGTGLATPITGLAASALAPGQRVVAAGAPSSAPSPTSTLDGAWVAIRESVMQGSVTTTLAGPTGTVAVLVDDVDGIDGARVFGGSPQAMDPSAAARHFDAFVPTTTSTLSAGDRVTVTGIVDATTGIVSALDVDEPAASTLSGTIDPASLSGRRAELSLTGGGTLTVEVLDSTVIRGFDGGGDEQFTFEADAGLAFLQGRTAPFPVEARGLQEAGALRLSHLALRETARSDRERVEGTIGPGAGSPGARTVVVSTPQGDVVLRLLDLATIEVAPEQGAQSTFTESELMALLADPQFVRAEARARGVPAATAGVVVVTEIELDDVVAPGFGFPGGGEDRLDGRSVPGTSSGTRVLVTGDGTDLGLGDPVTIPIDLAPASRIRFHAASGTTDLTVDAALSLLGGPDAFDVTVRGTLTAGVLEADRVEIDGE